MNTASSNKYCLLRLTAADREKLEQLLFKRYPRKEWGTFFRFGYRFTSWGLHITFVDMLSPLPGDLNRNSAIVEFDPHYILRAQRVIEQCELGIGVIHSHPQDCGTGASGLDQDMDSYFGTEFAMYGNGRPYASIRMAKTTEGEFLFSGEAWHDGKKLPITEILTLGPSLTRETSEFYERAVVEAHLNSTTQRISELLGDGSASRLRGSTVGIVGCSGTGSPAAHVLARARVGRFVLIDPDFFAPSNHERFHASTWRDLGRQQLKIDLLRDLILEINPHAEVIRLSGNVLDEEVLDALLLCDVVLGCTDTQHSRAALSDYASHYLLPCLDSGVAMRAKDRKLLEQVVELARYSPEEPCAWCMGRINERNLRYELMSDTEREERKRAADEAIRKGIDGEQYWGGTPPKELTVGYLTTAVGALQAGFAEGWITGASALPHQRFQFDVGMPQFGFVPIERTRSTECSCNRTKGHGDQARADRSVTKPHWNGRKEIS